MQSALTLAAVRYLLLLYFPDSLCSDNDVADREGEQVASQHPSLEQEIEISFPGRRRRLVRYLNEVHTEGEGLAKRKI